MKNLEKERLLELFADQTLFGLSNEEAMEFKVLKNKFPELEEDLSLELTAAMIGLSDLNTDEILPTDLRARIYANADNFFNSTEESQKVLNFASRTNQTPGLTATESVNQVAIAEPKSSAWQWLGWAFAAAACIALAVNLWLTQFQKPTETVKNPEPVQTPQIVQTPTPELTVVQKREQLLASATDVVQVSLASPKNKNEILGDMVWSNSQQKGYARLRGLPANNVAEECYQLWIVDETQNEKTPISGGVFDVSGTGEIVVPINAQLQVKKPKAVAVSKEKSGGVVVSKPERIVAIAKI